MNEEEIFHEAIELSDPTGRAAYLDRVCAGNPALRASLDALLNANVGASGFLNGPAPGLVATLDMPAIREHAGTVIGSYKLLEQIGEGGFGVVFMAEQTQPIHRKVALKIIKPGMDTRQVIARFEAERQALALMDHPNIASVFDGGETSGGRPYFVMELVKGIPITDFCDQGQLPVCERLQLFVDVCQAIQHAHQKGIIHRDLKPSNILVTLHDDRPVVKVIDFGIAKATGQQLTEKTLFTNFAQMIGTPLYMPPEQAALSGLDIDTRSDVYSLGVLLYELLAGTTPFDKERFRQVGNDEMRRIIREEEPPRPSTRISTLGRAAATLSVQRQTDPKRLRQLCRGELDWIVMQCLEKDRNRRYQTALELAADIRRHLQHEPVLACPPTLRYRLGSFLRKHRGPAAAAAALLLVLMGGVAATTAAYLDARASERQARSAEAEARATLDFLTYDMLGLAPEGAPGGAGRDITIREALDAAAPIIDEALGHDPRVEAAVCHVLGTTYRFLGDYDSASRELERAVALRRRALGEEDPATLTSEHSLSALLHDQNRLAEAEAMCRVVLNARRKQLPAGDVGVPSSLTLLGLILTDRGEPKEAEPLLREALVLFSSALPDNHWRTANAQSLLGSCLSAQGRYAEAEPLLVGACQTLLTVRGAPRHHTCRALEQTAKLYEAWGKTDKADAWQKKLQTVNAGSMTRSATDPRGDHVK
jgi:non-specific serine/threonine protein kinase/serine/threonine-protein kinase